MRLPQSSEYEMNRYACASGLRSENDKDGLREGDREKEGEKDRARDQERGKKEKDEQGGDEEKWV